MTTVAHPEPSAAATGAHVTAGPRTVGGPYSPASACGPGCLPRPGTVATVSPVVRAARLVGLALGLLGGVLVALSMPVLTRRGRGRAVRGWFRTLLRLAGVRLRVVGDRRLSPRPGTLVVANHVSWLDIPAMLATEPLRVVAKTDVRDWPVIGMMAARAGTLFIDRRRLRRLPVTVADMATSLRDGHSVLVFPEGSTWCGRTQGRFYPAAFQAAIDAGAPVRPVALRYRLADGALTTAAAFLGDETLLSSVLRVVRTRGLVVEVEAGPVADARGAARRSMATASAAVIRQACGALTATDRLTVS
jgi:1-acyl-sn-glycerol-3-phosphate acyltransferase